MFSRSLSPLRATTWTLAIVLVAGAVPAVAAPSIAERARSYAQKNNLPIREVALANGGTRIFVPVTDESHADFMREFTEAGAVIRQGQDIEHVQLALKPDEALHYGTQQVGGVWSAPAGQQAPMAPSQGGRYVAMDLDAAAKEHLAQNIGTPPAGTRKGGCMWWLVHAQVGKDVPLAHAMGIKQSAAPSNLVKKLVHAGNEKVVVGIAMSEQPVQVQQLHAQVQNFDNQIAQVQAQITNLENQGGNRIKQFLAQTAPYKDGIAQLEKTIAERQHQPAIAAGLGAKLDQVKAGLAQLSLQFEAPYQQRIVQLDQQIAVTTQNLAAQHQAQAQNLKTQQQLLAQRLLEKEQLEKAGPQGPGAALGAAYDQLLAQSNASVQNLQTQLAQVQAQFEARRVQGRQLIQNGEQQLAAVLARWPANLPPNPQRQQQFNNRMVQLDQQINANANAARQNAANPAQAANVKVWNANAEYLQLIKGKLAELGPGRYDPAMDQQLQQGTGVLNQGKVQLAQLDGQEEGQRANLQQQLNTVTAQRDRLVQVGRDHYNPQYEQLRAQLEGQIANLERQIGAYQAQPAQARNVVQWRAQLANVQQQKATLLQQDPADYNPAFAQRVAQLDQQIAQQRAQIAQLGQAPQNQATVAQLQQQLAASEASKAKLQGFGPRNYDPQFGNRLAQMDQLIAQAQNQLNAAAAQPAASRKQLDDLQALKAELVRNGPQSYNPSYEQRLAQLDQQVTQTEQALRQNIQPQFAAQRQQWAAQVEQLKKTKAELMAKGPAEYSTNEAQIAQMRGQLVNLQNQADVLRQRLAAIPNGKGNAAVAEKFATITDQNLLGAPPGGEAKLR